MKKELCNIFNYYKKKYDLKTTFDFKCGLSFSCFSIGENKIFYNLYSPQAEFIDESSIFCTSIGDFEGLLKDSREVHMWILLHEIKHAIDYTCSHKKLIKELKQISDSYPENRECYCKQLFEKRADRFAKKEIKNWRINYEII